MALVKCSECEKQVSSNATSCPHCGNRLPSTKMKTMYAIWLTLAIIFVALISMIFVSGGKIDIEVISMFIGLIGIGGFAISFIALLICFITRKKKKIPAICMLISFILFVISGILILA